MQEGNATETPISGSEPATIAVATGLVPPPVTGAYEKARKFLGISSAVLLAWEIVGIEFSEAPFKDIAFKLKSPSTVPYVLLVLTLYGMLRVWVEWLQCDVERRRNRYARVDFAVANSIAVAALAIYAVQRVRDAQIFQKFSSGDAAALLTCFAIAYASAAALFSGRPRMALLVMPLSIAAGWFVAVEYVWDLRNPFVAVGTSIGLTFALATGRWLRIAVWIRFAVSTLHRLWRLEIVHGSDILAEMRSAKRPAILASWREHRAVALSVFSRELARHGMPVQLPVQETRDFEPFQEAWRQVGIELVPVSRGPAATVRAILRCLRAEGAIVMAFDRRPAWRVVNEEVIAISARSLVPITPFAFSFQSWYRRRRPVPLVMPLPFGKVRVAVGAPFQATATNREERMNEAAELNARIAELERLLASEPQSVVGSFPGA